MLLAVDIGNTNVTTGLFRAGSLIATRRATTHARSSTDELGVTYSWDLGGPSRGPVTGSVVSIDYKRSGTFSVRLTVRDPRGQENSVTQSITVRK